MKSMFRSSARTRYLISSSSVIIAVVLGVVIQHAGNVFANPVQPNFNHFLSTHAGQDSAYDDNNPDARAQQLNGDAAYPASSVASDQTMNAFNAFQNVSHVHPKWETQSCKLLGPTFVNSSAQATSTTH